MAWSGVLYLKGACGLDFRAIPPPPSLIVFILCSDDHIFCLQNIKPRCVFLSIYETNPGKINGF